VEVDGRRVELERHRLSTSGHQAVLSGKLGGGEELKIEFDGKKERVRFGRGYPTEDLHVQGDALVVNYTQSVAEKHNRRIQLESVESEGRRLSMRDLGKPEALALVMQANSPEGNGGIYTFQVDRRLQESVRPILDSAMERGPAAYRTAKGEVGELLIPNLMTLCGWKEVGRHPFNETMKDGVTANDVDHAVWDRDHRLSIIEAKYWGQIDQAIKRGTIQVGAYYDRQRLYDGKMVERGYVMVMDWSLNDDPIRVHVKRVRPKEESV
jgi:hypothetical protein